MAAILTLRSGDVHPYPGPVTGRESKSQDATPSASCNLSGNFCAGCGKGPFRRMDIHQRSCKCAISMHCHLPEVDTDGFTTSGCTGHAMTDQHGSSLDGNAVSNNVPCPVCQSFFSDNNSMWQHVNLQHISKQIFPPVSVLKEQEQKLCASCGFSYSSHWPPCRRSLGPSHPRCGGQMIEPELSLWLQDMPSTGNGGLVPEEMTEDTQGANPPLMNDSELFNQSLRSTSNFMSADIVLKAIRSAERICCHLQQEFILFQAFMNEIMTLPIITICHIPRCVRPLFAEVLAKELRHATYDGVWGFARLSLLPKVVLR